MPEPLYEVAEMTAEQKTAFYRRRRARNYAIFGVLILMVAIFFMVALARMGRH